MRAERRASVGRRLRSPVVLLTMVALLGCATEPVQPQAPPLEQPALFGRLGETREHFLGRLLVDACTNAKTTEARIAVAVFTLEHCRMSSASCLRMACREIEGDRVPCRAEPDLASR